MNFSEDEIFCWNTFVKHQVKQELSVNYRRLKITMVKDLIRFHYYVIDLDLVISGNAHFKVITGITKAFWIFRSFMQF